MSVAGIILAAGASTRMGRPKPLLRIGAETFTDRLIRTMSGLCSPVIVVLGHSAAEVRAGIARASEVTIVLNDRWADGMLTSLQRGIAAVPAGAGAVLFTPVDHPHLRRATLDALAAEFARTGAPAVVARYAGRRGHPVLISRATAQAIAALSPEARAASVVNSPGAVYIDVDDPAVVEDIDDPNTYHRLLASGALA